ncbi:hypothetical protein AMELA_G00104320 [Ameiurus melas]|uniref:Ig-like domain-containing protein n=1 Tax=Ameiurus melas TaxID=219545 RepID=A0A7J6ATP9_AMEME|nr:hypothetical protein AMELA_G00104320 [Ameiurus melas]
MLPNEFLLAVIHLSAFVSGHTCVEQQPNFVHPTEGENVTLSCHIHVDEGEKINRFHVEWYREGTDRHLYEIGNLSHLRGRFRENTNINQQNASLSLFMLELNDTGKYFCNFIYRIGHKILQNYANGTSLIVQEAVTTDTTIPSTTNNTGNNTDADTENTTTENVLLTFLLSLPLSLKFVATVIICFYTLFSYTSIAFSCTGLLTNVR